MILGLHCPVWKGFLAALGAAEALGCQAMQVLPYRRHSRPAPGEMEEFRRRRAAGPVRRLLAHSRFVPSLASSDETRRRRSSALLAHELKLSAGWGAEAFVLHAGAYSPGSEAKEGLRLAAESIARASEESGVSMPIYVENVPGGGRRLGGTLEELTELLNLTRGAGLIVGACLDTAHAWAAGYDLASAEGMLKFLSRVHRLLGAESVRAFHLNDTRSLLGSHRENHCHWGEGYLGSEGLRVILQRPEYESALGILETPPDASRDAENLEFVRRLA